MSHEVRADEGRRLVLAVAGGRLEAEEVARMVSGARELAAARGWNILYDLRAVQPGAMLADLFWLPRRLPALTAPGAGRTLIACLHTPQFADLARYWETTFRNAGLQARAFEDEAAAVAWLTPGSGE